MIKIIIHSPIHSQILEGKEVLKDFLSYKTVFFTQGKYGKKRREGRKLLFNRQGVFYTGLLNRIIEYCNAKKIKLEITESKEHKEIEKSVKVNMNAKLSGVTLRPDQKRLVKSALEKKRGVIVSPTGAGKTLIALAIMKKFEGQNMLFLCPNLTILRQTISELKKFKFKEVCVLSGSEKILNGKIVVSNIQTFSRLNLDYLMDKFSIVVSDECHLAYGQHGTYEKILSKLIAPIRFGFTATLPVDQDKLLTLEGLIGEVIDTVTFDEGQEMKFLAKPKLKLLPVPFNKNLIGLTKYVDIYQQGIANYRTRNKIIISEADDLISEGNTVMIFITKIEHGEELYALAQDFELNAKFVRGEVESSERELIRHQLQNKEIDLVISTVVFTTGVNIPSLNAIILAGGGKSDIAVIQSIGRVLRKCEGKDYGLIIDLLDQGRYLSEHCVSRLSLYAKMGWL